MKRDCSTLRKGEQVVFKNYPFGREQDADFCIDGTVDYVLPEKGKVSVHYLKGYKDEHDLVSYEDMVAVYNPNGEYMKFRGVEGKSDLLDAK